MIANIRRFVLTLYPHLIASLTAYCVKPYSGGFMPPDKNNQMYLKLLLTLLRLLILNLFLISIFLL